MCCPLKLILMPVLLNYLLGGLLATSVELTVHVGNAALMGCLSQSPEETRVSKVDWIFSPGKHAKDEFVLYYYSNLSVSVERFQRRAHLVGDVPGGDGSLLLRDVQAADQGTYTCEIRREHRSRVLKTEVALRVLPGEPTELVVNVGDSIRLGCLLHSTEEKRVTSVNWTFSAGELAKEDLALHYDPKHGAPAGYPQAWGRFRGRMSLAGDTARGDGSILLRDVRASDEGGYTCHLHLGRLTLRKIVTLRVHHNAAQTQETPAMHRPELLGGTQLVTIVGIVCATVVLLPVLILIVRRTHRNGSSVSPVARVKSLENTEKAHPEKHVYSSITAHEVTEEEASREKSEPTYMTMHPVWPSLRSAPANSPGSKSASGTPVPAF